LTAQSDGEREGSLEPEEAQMATQAEVFHYQPHPRDCRKSEDTLAEGDDEHVGFTVISPH
jgi:hypothetical protein